MPNHVFLSYCHEDAHQSKVIKETIEKAGISFWRDQENILAGEILWDRIEAAISKSTCLLVILSPNSELKDTVKREVEIALGKRVPVIALLRNRTVNQLNDWWRERIKDRFVIETKNITEDIRDKILRAIRNNSPRQCKTVAFFNMKGGVGKTTLAAQIGTRTSRLLNKNVLLIDLDPQQNLTELFLTVRQLEEQKSIHKSIVGLFEPHKIGRDEATFNSLASDCLSGRDMDHPALQLPCSTGDGNGKTRLDIIAGQFEAIKYTEISANERETAIYNFKRGLEALRSRYDYIFIDCNPSASLLSKAALTSVSHVFCPLRPDSYARRGLVFMDQAIREFYRPSPSPELVIAFNFIKTKANRAERELVGHLRQGSGGGLPERFKAFIGKYLDTEIPDSDSLRSRFVPFYRRPFGFSLTAKDALDRMTRELAARLEKVETNAEQDDRTHRQDQTFDGQAEINPGPHPSTH